tara:strand:- start:335 stop:943 length:609 start_codon:yes stop_codon:yes gene_type:complete
MKLYEWIRDTIKTTPGLTQKGLAEAVGMNPATVNRMLYGRRHIRAEEVPLIENYLGAKYGMPAEHDGDVAQIQDSGFAAQSAPTVPQNLIPVYHGATGEGDIVDWVERHPMQKSCKDAYAFYVVSGAYEPRYYSGELVYIHPGKPPAMAQDCLVRRADGTESLYRYMGQSVQEVMLSNLQNGAAVTFPHTEIRALSAVVGRG